MMIAIVQALQEQDRQLGKCKECSYYQILNSHHIVEGIPVRCCVWGEIPGRCHYKGRGENEE